MINIDESCVNRSLKAGLSWIKGESKKIMSIKFYGSISIVTAILSNGGIFELLSNETIDLNKI